MSIVSQNVSYAIQIDETRYQSLQRMGTDMVCCILSCCVRTCVSEAFTFGVVSRVCYHACTQRIEAGRGSVFDAFARDAMLNATRSASVRDDVVRVCACD
jgi:hypothetical protein